MLTGTHPCRLTDGQLFVLIPAQPARVWERFETEGWITGRILDPFDPSEMDLWGEFEAPDGALHRIPAFFSQEFTRSLLGGTEVLERAGHPL